MQLWAVFIVVSLLQCGNVVAKLIEKDLDMPPPEPDIDYKQFENIIKNGLPKTQEPKEIIIVGAGMAGLSAAYVLKQAGHKVQILEANNRIGGRVYTYRGKEGWYGDLGAMRIPNTQKLISGFIEKFNLPLERFVMYNPNTYYLINNVREKTNVVNGNVGVLNFNLTQEELKLGSPDAIFDNAIQPMLHDYAKHGWDYVGKKYGHFSIKTYLDTKVSPGAVKLIGVTMNERSLFYTSVIEAMRDMTTINDQTIFHEVVGGLDLIPKAFLPELEENITMNARAMKIKQQNYKVQVEYTHPQKESTTVEGDYCIVTTTAKAALLIKYEPPLPPEKMYAMTQVHYDFSTKIFLYFSEAFWEEEGIEGGKSITDGPTRYTYYPNHKMTQGGVVLASYTWGDDAAYWTSFTDEQCKQMALNGLGLIHNKDLTPIYVNGVVKKWSEDEYSHGAFALFTPTQQEDLYVDLYKPEGRIYFAGEHTTLTHAWMEGAIASGLRSALEIAVDKYDIAVVGGGPIGLAAALFSAKQGASVVVLEKNTFQNNLGSSVGRTRQFRQMYANKQLAEYTNVSAIYWKTLEQWSGRKILYQDGYLFFGDPNTGATTEGNFKEIKKVCDELQMGCESLNSKQLSERFPFQDIPNNWQGLYHDLSGEIDVQGTLEALLKLNKEEGVTLLENMTVEAIQVQETNIQLKTSTNFIHAQKVILAPGPYANDVFHELGFQINLDIWEMPSYYYKIKNGVKLPTWFAFDGDAQDLYYGFPENSWERPGYVRVSPDFVHTPITDPANRTGSPDSKSFQKTTDFVKKYMPDVISSDNEIEKSTCLATMVPDGGFVLDFAPDNKDIVVFAAGWGFKFVPLFGKILSELALSGSTSYDISAFSINRPGILKSSLQNVPPAPSPNHTATILIVVVCLIILAVLIVIAVRTRCCKKSLYFPCLEIRFTCCCPPKGDKSAKI